MKKRNLLKMMILGTIFGMTVISNGAAKKGNQDCYIPKGELTCATDLTTEEGIKKAIATGIQKKQLYKAAEEYFKKGRFGNKYVGFIALPKGDWQLFNDPDTTLTAFQISRNMTDIFTLDALTIRDKKGSSDQKIAEQVIDGLYEGYLNAGNPKSNLVRKSVNINGYKGEQLTVKNLSGISLVTNVVVLGNKIYFVSAEGKPENIKEMTNWIMKSWNPEK